MQESESQGGSRIRCTLLSSAVYTLYATIKERLPYPIRRSLKSAYSCIVKIDRTNRIKGDALYRIKKVVAGKSNKKRILIVLNGLIIGGAESMMFTLLSGLRKSYEIAIITTSPEDRNEWLEKFTKITTKIYPFARVAMPNQFLKYYQEALASYRPDIVLISNTEAGYRWLAKARRINQAKIIDVLHNDSSEGFIDLSAEYNDYIDMHVVVGDRVKETLVNRYAINENKVTVVHNGIDAAIFKPGSKKEIMALKKKFSIPHGKKVVTFVGRFSGEKRPLRFARIARRLLQKRSDIHFVMVGDGRERKIIESYVSFFNMHKYFTLFGFQENVEEYLKITDCLLATSSIEGFFLTVLEALASGTTVVSSGVGEVKKMIRDGQNGYIIKKDSLNEYVEKVEDCLAHLSTRKEAIRKTVNTKFFAKNMVHAYNKLFTSMVAKK